MDERIKTTIVEYLCKTPELLLSFALMFAQGILLQMIFLGVNKKKKLKRLTKLRYALPWGIACSLIPFCILNIKVIIKLELTIEIFEARILSSAVISFCIVGIVAIVIFVVRQFKQLKGR